MTQTFAIPTIDDAEKDKYSINAEVEESDNVINTGSLDENNIEEIFGNPDVSDFDNIFDLGEKAGQKGKIMYIKSINNVIGYKDLPDGFK